MLRLYRLRLLAVLIALLCLLILPAVAMAQTSSATTPLAPGDSAIVVDPAGEGANRLRSAPRPNASLIIRLPVGTVVTILNEQTDPQSPYNDGTIVWYYVGTASGRVGWTAGSKNGLVYLQRWQGGGAAVTPMRTGGVAAVVPGVADTLVVYSSRNINGGVVGRIPVEGVVQLLSAPRLEGGRVWWMVRGRTNDGPHAAQRRIIEGWAISMDNGTELIRPLREAERCAVGAVPTSNNSHILMSMEDSPPSTDSKVAYVISKQGLNLRNSPGGDRIGSLRYGETVDVASGRQPTCQNGMVWWYVRSVDRTLPDGWASEGNPSEWLMLPSFYGRR